MIGYLIEGKELFKEIQDENYCDLIVSSVCLYKYKAYEHKFYLCKNIIKDNSLLQSDLSFLNYRKKILLKWKDKRKAIINKYKDLRIKKYKNLSSKSSSVPYNEEVDKELKYLDENYPHLAEYCSFYKDIEEDYYEDIEEDLIAYIDKILKQTC